MTRDTFKEISSTDELFQPPVTELNFPVITAIQTLPYNKLSNWKDFERLCLRLVQTIDEGNTNDIQLYKKEGSKQEGIDIYKVYRNEGIYDIYQCKHYNTFTKKDILKAVDEVKKNAFWRKIRKFYICTSADLSKYDGLINDLKIELAQENITFGVWDSKRLDIELKTQPQLVFEFFDGGLKPNFVEHFCGMDSLNLLFYDIPKIKVLPINNYITRKLAKQNTSINYRIDNEAISLIQLFEQTKKPLRILLLSTAGDGKTSDLKQLAYHFSAINAKDSLFPILIRLRDYTDENLPDLLKQYCNEWEKIKQSRLLLLFDGYDEVTDIVKEKLNKRFDRLSITHPEISMVVSSRNNAISHKFEHFDTYYLQKLSIYKEVYQYIQKHLRGRTDSFISLIRSSKMIDLLETPFYLVYLTSLYKESPRDFPQEKRNVFERIIEHINQTEIESKRITLDDWEDIELSQKTHLYLLSIKMLLMGKNTLTTREFKPLFKRSEDRSIVEKSPLLNKDERRIEFTHNLFQEYFVAKLLAEQSFETIKKCISFEPDYTSIKPKWTNTISSLFSILEVGSEVFKQLLDYIIQSDHTLLIRFESDKISSELRFTIFKQIIESPTKHYRNFHYDELIKFAGITKNQDIILYLLENIRSKDTMRSRDAIYLLSFAGPEQLFCLNDEIINTLKEVLEDKTNEENTHEDALRCIKRLNLASKQFIEWLFTIKPSFESQNVISQVFSLINDAKLVDDYCSFYLDNIFTLREISDTITGFKHNFLDGIKQVNSTTSIHIILDYVITNYSTINRNNEIFNEIELRDSLDSIVNKLVECYRSDTTIYDKVIKFIHILLHEYYDDFYFQKVKIFFKETNTTEQAFWHSWHTEGEDGSQWNIRRHFAYWSNKEIVNEWIKQYKAELFKEYDVKCFIDDLFYHDKTDLITLFLEGVNEIHPNKYTFPVHRLNKHEEIKKNDLDLLLDKPHLINLIKLIFNRLGERFERADITEMEFKDNPFDCHYPFQYINRFMKEDPDISLIKVLNSIEDNDSWTMEVLNQLKIHLQNKDKQLPEKHIEYILTWCDNQIPYLNFKQASNQGDLSDKEQTFAFFFQRMEIEVQQDILLDMLSFDTSQEIYYSGIGSNRIIPISDIVISKIQDTFLVEERILHNLEEGITNVCVLSNHFRLCRNLGIQKAKPYILDVIRKDILHESVARIIIDIYIELNGAIIDLDFILDNFNSTNDAHWYILEKLCSIERYKQEVNSLVEKFVLNSTPIIDRYSLKYKAMHLLIINGTILGLNELRHYVEYGHFDSHQANGWTSLAKIPLNQSIHTWEEILQISIQKSKIYDSFHRRELEGFLFEIFKLYAHRNESNFLQLKAMVSKYCTNNTDSNIIYLKIRLEDFEYDYLMNKVDIPDIQSAIAFCDKIGLHYTFD